MRVKRGHTFSVGSLALSIAQIPRAHSIEFYDRGVNKPGQMRWYHWIGRAHTGPGSGIVLAVRPLPLPSPAAGRASDASEYTDGRPARLRAPTPPAIASAVGDSSGT